MKTIVIGVIGADVHAVGNKIIEYVLKNEGYNVVNIGVLSSQEDFINAWKFRQHATETKNIYYIYQQVADKGADGCAKYTHSRVSNKQIGYNYLCKRTYNGRYYRHSRATVCLKGGIPHGYQAGKHHGRAEQRQKRCGIGDSLALSCKYQI